MFCTGVVIDPDVPSMADTHERARGVHTHSVLSAVVFPFSTLIDIFTVGIVISDGAEAIFAAAAGSSFQVHTV